MSFDDDDLNTLRVFVNTHMIKPELDTSGEEMIAFKYKINALLARLEAAEKIVACYEKHFRNTGKLTWPEIQLHEAWRKACGR